VTNGRCQLPADHLEGHATVLQQGQDGQWHDLGISRYKNPFGDESDGREDARITAMLGMAAEAAMKTLR
jgi:hypothetical protein